MSPAPRLLRRALGVVLLAGIAGCSHARSVEKLEGGAGPTVDAEGKPTMTINPEHPLVVDSPAKLLRPGAARRIHEALRKKGVLAQPDDEGLGETSSDAIARLQAENDLAATGFPDAETLKVLGFEPQEIYQSPPDEVQLEKLKRKVKSEARERAAKDEDLEEADEKEEEKAR